MDRCIFEKGELRRFIEQSQQNTGLKCAELACLVGLSARTIRDWKREKFNPSKEHIEQLSKISKIPLPQILKVVPTYWHNKEAAKLGGKKTYFLHGLLGNRESRIKGGLMSWYKREKDPELLKKYLNTFNHPDHSKDLAELVGILLGDGGLTDNQCVVYLNSETDRDYADYVKALMTKLFGLTPKVYPSKLCRVLRVSISGMNLIKYLTFIGLHTGNKVKLQVSVPAWIWTKPEYIKACIRGLIDTDGCFVRHKYQVNKKVYSYHKIAFSNRSKPILNFVFEGLRILGFTPRRPWQYQVWLHQDLEVQKYLREIGTNNYKPVVKEIIGGVA